MSRHLWLLLPPLAFVATVAVCCAVFGDEVPKMPTTALDTSSIVKMPTFTDLPEGTHIECDVLPGATSGSCRRMPDIVPDTVVVPSTPKPGCYVARVSPSMAVYFLREVPCE